MPNTNLSHTLPKIVRLRTREQFDHVFNEGKKLSRNGVAIFSCQNDFGQARLGIIAAKKNFNLAVQRNALKRVVRESFRMHRQALPGVDIIVYLYAVVKNFSKAELRLCLEQHWGNLISYAPK